MAKQNMYYVMTNNILDDGRLWYADDFGLSILEFFYKDVKQDDFVCNKMTKFFIYPLDDYPHTEQPKVTVTTPHNGCSYTMSPTALEIFYNMLFDKTLISNDGEYFVFGINEKEGLIMSTENREILLGCVRKQLRNCEEMIEGCKRALSKR